MRKYFICMLLLFVFGGVNYCWAEAIAVIVNSANAEESLSVADLARIYKGRQQVWSDGRQIVAVNRPAKSEVRRVFYEKVLNSKPTKKFYDPGSPALFRTTVQRSSSAMMKFVANMQGAIGYVYMSEVDKKNTKIKTIKVIE